MAVKTLVYQGDVAPDENLKSVFVTLDSDVYQLTASDVSAGFTLDLASWVRFRVFVPAASLPSGKDYTVAEIRLGADKWKKNRPITFTRIRGIPKWGVPILLQIEAFQSKTANKKPIWLSTRNAHVTMLFSKSVMTQADQREVQDV